MNIVYVGTKLAEKLTIEQHIFDLYLEGLDVTTVTVVYKEIQLDQSQFDPKDKHHYQIDDGQEVRLVSQRIKTGAPEEFSETRVSYLERVIFETE